MRTSDLCREMVHRFADDLKVAFDRVLCHFQLVRVAVKNRDMAPAPLNRLENMRDALGWVAAHNATASMSAEAETGRLRSWTGNTSMSSRPNSARVSANSPEARIRRFPSAGLISTKMSMSDPEDAVPRATDPKSFELVAAYRSRSAWNSSRRESMSSRMASRGSTLHQLGVYAYA